MPAIIVDTQDFDQDFQTLILPTSAISTKVIYFRYLERLTIQRSAADWHQLMTSDFQETVSGAQ